MKVADWHWTAVICSAILGLSAVLGSWIATRQMTSPTTYQYETLTHDLRTAVSDLGGKTQYLYRLDPDGHATLVASSTSGYIENDRALDRGKPLAGVSKEMP